MGDLRFAVQSGDSELGLVHCCGVLARMISMLSRHAIILSYLVSESASKAEAQAKSSDERIELVGRLPEAAASNWNFADNSVRVRDVEEICDRFEVESVSKSSWTRQPEIDDVDVWQADITDLFADHRYLPLVETRNDCCWRAIVGIERIAGVVLKV